jgi:hypothetical protein
MKLFKGDLPSSLPQAVMDHFFAIFWLSSKSRLSILEESE